MDASASCLASRQTGASLRRSVFAVLGAARRGGKSTAQSKLKSYLAENFGILASLN
jgi:hypothetical protein